MQSQIRIIDVPRGEAPEAIRRAWVGLVVPLAPGETEPKLLPEIGIYSGPRGAIGQLAAILTGQCRILRGYLVRAEDAIEALERSAPEAAAWWRDNVPHLFRPNKRVVFEADVCEEATESTDGAFDRTIRVHVVPSFADYLRWLRRREMPIFSRFCPFLVLGVALLFLTRYLGGISFGATFEEFWPMIALGIAFFGVLPFVSRLHAGWFWQRNGELREPRSYEFSRSGIRDSRAGFSEARSWQHVASVSRSGDLVIIAMRAEYSPCLVPLRAFRSESDWLRFRRMVLSHVLACRLGSIDSFRFPESSGPDDAAGPPESPRAKDQDPLGTAAGHEPVSAAGFWIRFVPTFPLFCWEKRWRIAMMLALPAVLLAVLFVTIWCEGDLPLLSNQEVCWRLLGLAVGLLCVGVATTTGILLLLWLRTRQARETQSWGFSESGIEVKAESFAMEMGWQRVKRIQRTGPVVVLTAGDFACYPLPRSAFDSEQWQRFGELASAKVQRCELGT